mgnify:CR=1 FL=1
MAPRTVKSMKNKVKYVMPEGSGMSVTKAVDVKTELETLAEHYKDSPFKTKKTYIDNYKKVKEAYSHGIVDLGEIPLEDMILVAGQLSESYASQRAYLNIWSICNFKLKSYHASEPYIKYIDHLQKGIESQMRITHKIKLDSVFSSEDIIAHEESMYKQERWSAYVACRIVRELLCRNKDLGATVVDKYEDIPDANKGNWLICDTEEIKLIRNDYKTARTYGTLINNLNKDDKLINACSHLPRGELLFPGSDTAAKLQNRLRKSLLTNEVGYLNSAIEDVKKVGNIGRLRQISATRGSSLEQLLTSYDLGYLVED